MRPIQSLRRPSRLPHSCLPCSWAVSSRGLQHLHPLCLRLQGRSTLEVGLVVRCLAAPRGAKAGAPSSLRPCPWRSGWTRRGARQTLDGSLSSGQACWAAGGSRGGLGMVASQRTLHEGQAAGGSLEGTRPPPSLLGIQPPPRALSWPSPVGGGGAELTCPERWHHMSQRLR